MAKKTNAVRILDRESIAYELRDYDLTMEEFSAAAVAAEIGLPAHHVFKTLVATVDGIGPCFAVVPGDAELDLKALAKAAGGKRAHMAPVKDVESLTGYIRGGVTVLGAKRPYPTFLDASAPTLPTIAISAGSKGLQILLTPTDYLTATNATVAPIAKHEA